MKINRPALALALVLACYTPVFAGEAPVKVENGWVRAVPDSLNDTAAFMTLINNGSQALRLTGGHTEIAGVVMPMITTREIKDGKEVMGMKRVDALVVPAHGQLVLEPGGDHLMIMQLKKHPKAGDKVKLTLEFDSGKEELALELPVSLMKP